ncbi:hypothetical protein RD792_000532 [Penstemon davidsonii]|uniref:MLO-like protein n=1 Tax=Penstemon davidsonii TaxID=160366 RepID=A0ABR0DKY1_9LAMI|nr:hypothetical protein RD792_000532 [Penstemon davidsonii]
MAGGGGGEKVRELNQTPTWAVALVVAVIIIISILLEKTLHKVGQMFQRRKKVALVEALEKIKAELMVLGFISLILTFGQNYITRICIPYELANTFLPCDLYEYNKAKNTDNHRRLLWYEHRILAADSPAEACKDVCFFRHITYSVRRPDYLTLRHGFITVHLAPGTKFNFQKYIKRSLEDDFKVIVGIPMACYVLAVCDASFVGTKLQSIITRMAIEIQQRHAVVQGIPLVQVSDKHFWFRSPTFILYLIHLTLFQNAFEITHFIWITYEFGYASCFNDNEKIALLRVFLGLGVQFLISYITLPLYALVTQMGSHMKRSIFDEQTSKALKHWHEKVRKKPHTPRKALLAIKGPEDHSPLAAAAADHKSSPFGGNAAAESSSIEMDNTKVDIPEDIPTPLDNQSGNKDLLTGL